MFHCSECGRGIGRFDQDNPPVCPNGRGKKIAKPTVLSVRNGAVLAGGPTGASPTFQGDTDID